MDFSFVLCYNMKPIKRGVKMIYLTEEDKNKIQYDGWNKVTRLNLSSGSYYAKFKRYERNVYSDELAE